jgi:DNA uptake protein ComE-like DNA-binding protein
VAIPGIGTKFAERFLSDRPAGGFTTWEQVDQVKGVGPSRLKQLQERFELP